MKNKNILFLTILCSIVTIITKHTEAIKQDLAAFNVDFDEAMGKNNPYLKPFYERFMSMQQQPKHDYFRYVKPYSPVDLLKLSRSSYAKNKPTIKDLNKTRIPRIFHQIWVGKKPFPEKYKLWQKTWQSVPGWSYKLWTDKDVETFNLINKDRYYKESNMAARADILRLEILFRYGGVYCDTDFELLKPELFDALTSSVDFFCGITPPDVNAFEINNAILGSIPGHPIIQACIETLPTQPEGNDSKLKFINNGPGLVTRMVLLHANKKHRDIVLPSSFVFPLAVYQVKTEPYESMPNTVEKLEIVKRDVCKPESMAVHWWEASWKMPDAWEQMAVGFKK